MCGEVSHYESLGRIMLARMKNLCRVVVWKQIEVREWTVLAARESRRMW